VEGTQVSRQQRRAIPHRYRPVLLAAALVAFGLLFRELATLLLAVLITVILAIPLSAAATELERFRVPRPIGALLALLLGLCLLGGTLALIVPPLAGQVSGFVDEVPSVVDSLGGAVGEVTGDPPSELGGNLQEWLRGLVDSPESLVGPLATIGLDVAGVLGAILLVLLTALFMAARPEPLLAGALRVVPPGHRDRALTVMARLRTAWVGWIKGVAFDMAVTALLLFIGLTLVGLEFALFFAVLSALLVLIPYFGSIIGGIPPVLFALADSPTKALLVLGIYVAVQQIESNVIVPLVMARTTRLHPALVAVGVVVAGQLFGVLGFFVAVPMLSALVVLVEEAWVRPLEEAEAREGLEVPVAAHEEVGSGAPPGDIPPSLRKAADEATLRRAPP
jgi:predicted PurR-regulated permease PerM